MLTLSAKAANYAINCHRAVNHKYDGNDYSAHLTLVLMYLDMFKHHILPEDQETVLAAGWAHDVIEDTRQTYNDVVKVLGMPVADIVYALTNEKGKNRKERANRKYYDEMKLVKYAVLVKLCDRLANIDYSKRTQSGMFAVYQKEYAIFNSSLLCHEYQDVFEKLHDLLFNPK